MKTPEQPLPVYMSHTAVHVWWHVRDRILLTRRHARARARAFYGHTSVARRPVISLKRREIANTLHTLKSHIYIRFDVTSQLLHGLEENGSAKKSSCMPADYDRSRTEWLLRQINYGSIRREPCKQFLTCRATYRAKICPQRFDRR